MNATTPKLATPIILNAIVVVSMIFCLMAGVGVSGSEAAVDKAEYELQERCGLRAAEMFEKQYGTGMETTDDGYRLTTYSNNYSATFNKCFMSLHTVTHGRAKPGQPSSAYDVIDLELRDVNGNSTVGICIYLKGSLPDSGSCQMAGRNIATPGEWQVLEEPYMQ